jgi:hypothetical protein
MTATRTTLRALRDLVLIAAAGVTAASIWASGVPEEGLLLDAELWKQEVAAGEGHWPADGWYRLEKQEKAIEVRAVKPDAKAEVPEGALYFRLPGVTLKQGARASYRHPALLAQPRLGQDYELMLGKTRFGMRVESAVKGMQYVVSYGGETFTYVLGPFDATSTSVQAVADLDGDAKPDFLIEVGGDAMYLLLSSRARPGHNLPTAELWAKGC